MAADAPAIFAMSRQAGMREWLPDQVYADLDQAREIVCRLIGFYATPDPRVTPVVLGVCAPDGPLIGHVGLSRLGDAIEIGYAIDEAQRGRGFATAAVCAMTRWGLVAFALPSIDAIVAADNLGSCTVLERAGFVKIGEAHRPLHGVTRLVRTYRVAVRRDTSCSTT
ncbi:MAG: GNAT family N-acetyltransferase [Kofleriaceae bacterium]